VDILFATGDKQISILERLTKTKGRETATNQSSSRFQMAIVAISS
jgi:hypothetical protein